MKTILISYDLQTPGKDYVNLWEHLRSYGNYAKLLESMWLLRTYLSAEQVRDNAIKYIDQNDKIFVVDVTKQEYAWYRLPTKIYEWMGYLL